MNKTDHIIFCLSYLHISIVCQLIEDKKAVNVTVISNVPNIIRLISELFPSIQTLLVESKSLNPFDLFKQKLFYLINNVVWEREVSFQRTKTQLELSFTPEVKGMLNEKS